ncbi:MAG: DUF5676 family membrane protein [Burkholderiaceae bacterium]|nr:DUF5676 family membrane protein [Burkholderiaceae bacterium]
MTTTPLRTGIALAITVGLFYALCALVWALAPGPFLAFMNNLFHGMDFSALVQPRPFAWPGFGVALLVLSAWAMLAGMFFAWLLNRLAR